MKKLIYFTFLLIAGIGCSNVDIDEKLKEDEEKKNKLIFEEKKNSIINSLCKQFNAVQFPSKDIDATSNTLKIQTFLKANKTVLFNGNFEDVYEKDGETIVVLSFTFMDFTNDESTILFYLSVPENTENVFKDNPKRDFISRLLSSWLTDGDNYFVCECYSANSTNILDNTLDEEGKTFAVVKNTIIVTGKFIKAIEIPSPKKELSF